MVTEDEQTKFFNTIFSPLKNPSKAGIKDAKEKAFEFVKGEHFRDIDNNILDLWDLSALNEEQANSWKWLRALKERYKGIVFNDNIKIHKFVWHKKQNEAGWGPKLVTEIMGTDQHQFLYVTKPMDEAKIELIKTVGSVFNLFQPVQQGFSHDVSVEQAKDFTIISVLADNGETLEKEFESILKPLGIQGMDNLFQKIIELYLQPIIDHRPSLGFVAPVKYGKEWKYGYEWTKEKNPQLKNLRDFEKTAPFIVPLRWEKDEQTQYMTLLHGDEWGGNFMAPPSNSGSIRPIDFEDAHIQRVEVELDDQKNFVSYLKPSQDQESHKTAGGSLAYRFTSRPGKAPPLHAYSAMSALGRLFAALVQKQTLKTNPQEADEWIEEVTARFFNNLRNSLNKFISSPNGKKYLDSLNLDPEITRRGLMVRAVLATYNWSEHWKYKTRDNDDHAEYFIGKWKKSSLEEFQFQLMVQGDWEVCSRDNKGRPATIGHDYAKILRNEIDSWSEDWTDGEQEDICTAISRLEVYGNTGVKVTNDEYREIGYLDDLLPFEKDLSEVVSERRKESTKHERLGNKINFINAHFILQKEEVKDLEKEIYDYFIKCIDAYPINEHWKDTWIFWRDIYAWVGMVLKPASNQRWTVPFNFDAQINYMNNVQYERIENTFQPGTLLERDKQAFERNLILTKHIAYLNSFRKRIVLSSGEDYSVLLDSNVIRFCSHVGNLIFHNLSMMDYTDLDFLTNLLCLANTHKLIETEMAMDVPYFVLATFAELGFNDKTEEIEQFFVELSKSMKTCFTLHAKLSNNTELMEAMLEIISGPKQQLLRAWAIEFIDCLIPDTQRKLQHVPWYKIWNSL